MTIAFDYIGCDISKAYVDIYDPKTGRRQSITNTAKALAAFLLAYQETSAFFVFEATGVYDSPLAKALAQAGLPFHRANPMMARRFAQAMGQRAKTDQLDAVMLAQLGSTLRPAPTPPPCPQRAHLAQLQRRRDQLVRLRAAEQTRLHDSTERVITASLKQVMAGLDRAIVAIDQAIAAALEASDHIAQSARMLTSAPGVGPVTATVLLAALPELGQVNPKQIAALAGLAPFNHDSGTLRGRRCISGGRARVRRALYMAALGAIKASARFRAVYTRIAEKAPAKKIAIIAVARKLLVTLNAMMRDQKAYA